jgi:hypothetical protein
VDILIQHIVTIEAKNGLLYVDEKRGEVQGFC